MSEPVMFDGAEALTWAPLMAAIEKVWEPRHDPEDWTDHWGEVVTAWDAYVAEVGAVHLAPGSLVEAIEAFVEAARDFSGGDQMATAYFDLMDAYGARFHPNGPDVP